MRNINATLLSKARTSLFVAHRCVLPRFSLPSLSLSLSSSDAFLIIRRSLKTIADADVIIVLKDGAVAEQGTHEELLARKGVYRGMWEQQNAALEL
jgi:ATP-binding cassette subfamily B (MDR/TAP) protein 7